MIRDKFLRDCFEKKDITSLRNAFSFSLDNDPSFELYRNDYEECKSVLFESHIDLTPFEEQESGKWSDPKYWGALNHDLKKNFSQQRFEHMMKVARVLYADKLAAIQQKLAEQSNIQCISAPAATYYKPGSSVPTGSQGTSPNPAAPHSAATRRETEIIPQRPRESAEERNRKEVQKRLAIGATLLGIAAVLIVLIVIVING